MVFGRELLQEWLLDPSITYLNHPTVGATPRRVLNAQHAIQCEAERQPSRFQLRELTGIAIGHWRPEKPRLRQAAEVVAAFVHARGDDFVFVDNTTTGANAVLRSFPLAPGDEVLVSELSYGGVVNAAKFVARERGASVCTMPMPTSLTADALVDAFAAAVTPRTRLAIVEHIAPEAAIILPLADIAACLKQRGVAVLADGAHVPGAISLDVPAQGVDWYVANLHKWAFVPRSSGFLWASPERQAGLHPAVVSWGLDQGFTAEFDLPGTRDASAHLAAPAALDFMASYGVKEIFAHNHALAWNGSQMLAQHWGTAFDTPESLIGPMATVPLPDGLGTSRDDAGRLRDALLFEDRIEVPVLAWRNRLYVRVSAQIYNDMRDFERLAAAISARVRR
jgi:isopenicillin-N epimerase